MSFSFIWFDVVPDLRGPRLMYSYSRNCSSYLIGFRALRHGDSPVQLIVSDQSRHGRGATMQERRQRLFGRFTEAQEKFDALCAPLTGEEHRIQPITEASPPWWSVMH